MTPDLAPASYTALRRGVFVGRIFRIAPMPAALQLADQVWEVVRDTLGPGIDPRTASRRLEAPELFARVVGARETLVREARFAEAVGNVLLAAGAEPGGTAFDGPRLRGVASGAHRIPAARSAYALHRDTWYANPRAQLNWWMPLHDVEEAESIALYPEAFGVAVPNDSNRFDHDTWSREVGWQAARAPAGAAYPEAKEDVEVGVPLQPALRRGELLVFSAAHLHRASPHDSGRVRYSLDFRSVDLGDVDAGRGAVDVDNASRGSALVEYRRL